MATVKIISDQEIQALTLVRVEIIIEQAIRVAITEQEDRHPTGITITDQVTTTETTITITTIITGILKSVSNLITLLTQLFKSKKYSLIQFIDIRVFLFKYPIFIVPLKHHPS